ncbi:beta-ketoacyl-[acyl-carrier-protein] synthase family protein [Flammeovirgaceae bacterium SG7u.111]|nr:beta-ketoacyl-[acyl-carrier-protein] synthase family protein [Flammeovirgaceae bacterium SG7u.132]WPO36167.1 beta-ketoacyl-[acyl-carrier-protein] synthase family protein [Flammeovirgaceae bacterium SG7u.111]
MQHRVVITGLGIYSSIGTNLEEVKKSLYEGKSGIGIDPIRKELGFRSALTAILPEASLKGKISRRARVGLPQQGEFAYLSTVEALGNANISQEYLDENEVGIIFGNDSSAKPAIDAVDTLRKKHDTTLIGSGSIFQSMNSTVTMNLSTIFKLKGVNYTISAACASGSHAIGNAYMLIKNGYQDMIVCGGAQEVNFESMGSFDGLGTFSIREGEPTKASRPFDRDRDGLIPSGGAATVIIESLESAQRRGAPILAEILGYGFSSNGEHISSPNISGASRSLEMALRLSGVKTSEIDYINAHATSTPIGDVVEGMAIDSVFGDYKPEVSSTKSMTGHEMWMAGASEIVYSILMMQNDFIAQNLNLENPDEKIKGLNLPQKTIEKRIDTFLSNSFGFGGTNSTLIVRKI